ncbi:MAG: DHH family phosphoesterase [Candidatus Marsarchaeota archaeon]|jgi:nanoRNase/pAp phosphatase (c-di-AMP/oligoRNAs hydrolase)|nr:DHH family phosphoesterase [Candidatus Marsarchaeota archaeon]
MEIISFDALEFIVKEAERKGKKVLITFHSIGDSDSVASALALKNLFNNTVVATPDAITANAIRMLKAVDIDYNIITNKFEDADIIFLVDVNNFEDCGNFRYNLENFKKDIVIIDHHALHQINNANVSVFNDEKFNSTSSIIYELIKRLKFPLNKSLGYILLYGIVSDSADLKNTFPDTFIQIGELLKFASVNYNELLSKIEPAIEPKSREATLEDICTAEKIIINDLLFIYGKAHSHANVSADVALKSGADLVLFYSLNTAGISFSARLVGTFDKKYGIHLGKIMKELAPIIDGSGGGHPCAAGAYGPLVNAEIAFKEAFIKKIKDMVI